MKQYIKIFDFVRETSCRLLKLLEGKTSRDIVLYVETRVVIQDTCMCVCFVLFPCIGTCSPLLNAYLK